MGYYDGWRYGVYGDGVCRAWKFILSSKYKEYLRISRSI